MIDGITRFLMTELNKAAKDYENLKLEDRMDEANFIKVRINVLDIFQTMLNVAQKKYSLEQEIFIFFEKKLIDIPTNWRTTLEKAKINNDFQQITVEEIKLAVVSELLEVIQMEVAIGHE